MDPVLPDEPSERIDVAGLESRHHQARQVTESIECSGDAWLTGAIRIHDGSDGVARNARLSGVSDDAAPVQRLDQVVVEREAPSRYAPAEPEAEGSTHRGGIMV